MKMSPNALRYYLFAALLSLSVGVQSFASVPLTTNGTDANWPQWRGPASAGISPGKDFPTEWSPTKNIRWKTPLPGRGHSSPIVWGDRVFLTTAIEGEVVPGASAVKHMMGDKEFLHPDSMGADRKHTFKVLSFDSKTGKLLWERTAFTGTPYDNRHRRSSYAASTPVTDGRRVYAFFGAEGLYCYDFNGKLVWSASLGKLGTVGMGTGTSPILYENLVILQCDHEAGDASFIVALDKRTGKEVWRTPRKVQVSWSTPVLARTSQRTELITTGTEFIIAYDPLTGRELWRSRGVESNAIPTAVTANDIVYVAAGFPAKIAMALRLGGKGDISDTPSVIWKYKKGTAYVPSPILYGAYLYLMTDKGVLTCLDALSGAVKYEGGRVPVPATFTASPVAFADKLLLTSEDGDTFILRAGEKHEVLATNSLGEPVFASPALAQGKIFIRGEKHLYCIGQSAKK